MGLKKRKNWAYIFILIWTVLLLLFIYESIHIWFDINNIGFVLCLILIVFCFFFWIRNILKGIKVKNLRQELIQHGEKVKARVLLILRIPDKNRDHAFLYMKYKIVAKYMKETFCSEEYSTVLDKVIWKWDKIDVYIDENDHSRYWMDVDTLFEEKSEKVDALHSK